MTENRDEPDHAAPQVVVPYRLRWRPRGERPGAHPAHGEGGEGTFRGLVPLLGRPDPRRIDLRATIRDPFEAVHVRSFAPYRATVVAALTDVSASMDVVGMRAEIAKLAANLAASATAAGDSFMLLAADEVPRDDIAVSSSRRRGTGQEVYARLLETPFGGRSVRGLIDAARALPRRRCLVFLISDFLLPEEDLAAVLDALWAHDVMPVVVRDSRTEGDLPAYGLIEAHDAETGRRRLIFMRPALRRRWQEEARKRLTVLDAIFASRGLAAFHLIDRFDPNALVDFMARR